MIVTFERRPDSMRRVVHLEPLVGRHLVRADHAPHLVVEDLRGSAGQRGEPLIPKHGQVLVEREPERRGALPHLERREGVHVDPGHGVLDRAYHGEVVVAVESRVDPALQADLGRPPLPGLLDAADDLLVRDEVGGAAQVLGELALRERAEPAAEVADVRVLDVAGDDVAHLVAADLPAEPVGRGEDPLPLLPARLEQAHELVLAELVPGELERRNVAADDERHASRPRPATSGPRGRARAHRRCAASRSAPPGRASAGPRYSA